TRERAATPRRSDASTIQFSVGGDGIPTWAAPVYISLLVDRLQQAAPPEVWQHVAFITNGRNLISYLGGTELTRAIWKLSGLTHKPLKIGGVRDPYFFDATVDEIRIYNRAKTAEEIAKDAAQ